MGGTSLRSAAQRQGLVFGKAAPQAQKTLWFIFGIDEELPIKRGWQGGFFPNEVKALPEDQLQTYLLQRGVNIKEDREFIIKKTQGLPAAVQILLKIYQNKRGQFDQQSETEGYTGLFRLYFSRHMGSLTQTLVSTLSLFDCWDMEIVQYIKGNDCNTVFQGLIQNAALVEKSHSASGREETTYRLVDIVRKTMQVILSQEENRGMRLYANRRKYGYEKQKADALMDKWGKKQV